MDKGDFETLQGKILVCIERAERRRRMTVIFFFAAVFAASVLVLVSDFFMAVPILALLVGAFFASWSALRLTRAIFGRQRRRKASSQGTIRQAP